MSLPGLLVTIFSALMLGVLIFGPVLQRGGDAPARTEADAIQRQRESLRLAYNGVLKTLRDLEEDYATGKLSDSDYGAEKARWSAEGVRLLRERDDARHAAGVLQKMQRPRP